MNKLKEFIMKDIGWKILSVAIAVCLWFVVINIENPVETRKYTVPVTLLNEELIGQNDLIISNAEELDGLKVSINVRGHRIALDRLSQNKSHILATIDLEDAVNGQDTGKGVAVSLNVTLPNSSGDTYEIIGRDPLYVYVKLDGIVTVTKDIQVDVIGQTGEGYVMANPDVTPKSVKITGAKSLVEKVESAKAAVSADNLVEDITVTAPILLYDAENTAVTGLTLSDTQAQVTIAVNKSKSVPVRVVSQGQPQEGYLIESVIASPDSIEVVGSEDVLSQFTELTLPGIYVEGKTETMEASYNIKDLLPVGLNIRSGSQEKITVKAVIVKEAEKEIHLPMSQISVSGNLAEGLEMEYAPSFKEAAFTISGPPEEINKITESALKGQIDITGLGAGEHQLEITVTLPEDVSVSSEKPMASIILSAPSESGVGDELKHTEENQP